mmetsp:Transcript_1686/g.2757  ORF Transcript_1686/g.2757 Transcript_1686/m.2757 type:complete len:98 (+) Transcript_1686:152-445(+)
MGDGHNQQAQSTTRGPDRYHLLRKATRFSTFLECAKHRCVDAVGKAVGKAACGRLSVACGGCDSSVTLSEHMSSRWFSASSALPAESSTAAMISCWR